MKTIKKVLIGVAGLLILLLIIAFLLPSKYHIERSIKVKANKAVIYDLTSHYKNWDLWTPWTREIDTTATFALIGPDGQVGTKRIWNGTILKDGEMTFTQLLPGELIAYDIAFQQGKYKSKGKITIESVGDSCRVTWIDEGDLGNNPFSRYKGLFMGSWMNPDFDKGLSKLKIVAEKRSSWPKIEETVIPEQEVLVVLDSAGMKDYEKVMGNAYSEIFKHIQTSGLTPGGRPFSIYLKWDSVTKFSVMKIGVPVNKPGKDKGRVKAEKIASQKAVVAYYFGPYDKIEPAYNALHEYVRDSKMEVSGGPIEVYMNDPMTEKDPMKLETAIFFPIK